MHGWPEGQGLHYNGVGKNSPLVGARCDKSYVKNPHLCAMIEYAKILATTNVTGELGLA